MWSLLLAFDRRRANFALVVLCGLLFIAALFAKVTALIVLPLPIVIAVVFTRWPISDRLKALALLYATVGLTWLPFGLAFSSRQIDYFGLATKIAPTADVLLGLDRLGSNLSLMLEGLLAYHSIFLLVPLSLCALFALKYRQAGSAATPIFAIGYAVAIAWLSKSWIVFRYFLPALPFFFIAAGMRFR